MNPKKIEARSLTISALVNGLSGLAGLAVYIITDLNALLLDGVFSLIASFKELAHGTIPAPDLKDTIYKLLAPYLEEEEDLDIHIFKQGMQLRVKIHLHHASPDLIHELKNKKQEVLYQLRKHHEYITIEYAF